MARKPFGRMFELLVINCLDGVAPHTAEHIRNVLSEKLGKPGLSWHTVKKYLNWLRDSQKIEELHSGKITTYRLKK